MTFAGAAETLNIRLLPKSQSGLSLASNSGALRHTANIVLKVTRTKWDAHKLPLHPGEIVTVGLKSYKLLRG